MRQNTFSTASVNVARETHSRRSSTGEESADVLMRDSIAWKMDLADLEGTRWISAAKALIPASDGCICPVEDIL